MKSVLVTTLLVACVHSSTTPQAPVGEGITISLYKARDTASSYGVIDDRRRVTIAANELVLDHVPLDASLASLVIEPLAGEPLAIEKCSREALPPMPAPAIVPPKKDPAADARDRIELLERQRAARLEALGVRVPAKPPAPVVVAKPATPPPTLNADIHCTITGASGPRLVRVLYTVPKLTYGAQHDITIRSLDKATIASRFTIETPRWNTRADVVLYDGLPGAERPPKEIMRGPIVLDGSTAIVPIAELEVPATVRRIYRGAVESVGVDSGDPTWNAETRHDVWVWLGLGKLALVPGVVYAHLALPNELPRDVATTQSAGDTLELPLYIDRELSGTRMRFEEQLDSDEASALTERVLLSVANTGDAPKEVWVEEQIRTAKRRKVERAWPKQPHGSGDIVREKLVVKPHAIERMGFSIGYVFQ
ncbi:MAG: hypothetical protein QM831_00035 [Kofleriaceae bacterium]